MQSRVRLTDAPQQMLREFKRRKFAGFQQTRELC
jgi:hypothetical protein